MLRLYLNYRKINNSIMFRVRVCTLVPMKGSRKIKKVKKKSWLNISQLIIQSLKCSTVCLMFIISKNIIVSDQSTPTFDLEP